MRKIFFLLTLSFSLFAQTGLELAQRSYETMTGYKSSIAHTTMLLKNGQEQTNKRELEIRRLEDKDGDSSLITFLYPNDIKGTKLLSQEQVGEEDKQWLYMPALRRVKRIASNNKSGSFMGSEFSYEDIASQHFQKYNYQEKVQKIDKDSQEYFELVRFPKESSSAYSKQILYIDTKTYLPVFGIYYDKDARIFKEISFLEYTQYGSLFRIKKMQMKNLLNNKSTLLVWDEEKIEAGLGEKDFHLRVLQ